MPSFNPAYFLDKACQAKPDSISIHYGEEKFTVAQSVANSSWLRELLQNCGVQSGDRVAIIARNSPYHLWLQIACARIGAILVPLSYRLTSAELRELLSFSTPKICLVDCETALAHDFATLFTAFPCVTDTVVEVIKPGEIKTQGEIAPAVFYIDDDPATQALREEVANKYVGIRQAKQDMCSAKVSADLAFSVAEAPQHALLENRNADDGSAYKICLADYPEGVGAIFFTSGSVGTPKAVALTYEQLWWGSQNFRIGFEYSTNDVELVVAPFNHIGGFNGTTLDIFSHGGTVVVVREFHAQAVLEQLAQHQVALFFGVPAIYAALLNHPEFSRFDLSKLRAALIGGAVSPPELLKRMYQHGLPPINVWGMTEVAASGTYLSKAHALSAAGAIGQSFIYNETALINPELDGDDLPVTEEEVAALLEKSKDLTQGELIIRGPSVIRAYWNMDARQNAQYFIGDWLRTGDLMRKDTRGNYWVIGRRHNLINSGGEKITAEELMAVMGNYPGVSESFAVPVPDAQWGEVVAAVLVMRPQCVAPSLAQLQDFMRPHLASYKLPKYLVVLPALPVNGNGKVAAKLVRAEVLQIVGASPE